MFGNNRLVVCCISSRGIDEKDICSGLVFSDSKMAALKSLFLINSRSTGNRMINHVSIMHYVVVKCLIMIILDYLAS